MSYKPMVGETKLLGSVALVAWTATVNTAHATSTAIILLTAQSGTLNAGEVGVSSRVNGVSFTITSFDVLDTRTIGYEIIEP